MTPALPSPIRYVTTTSPTGESSTLFSGPVKMVNFPNSESTKGDVWITGKFPAEVQGTVDLAIGGVGMVGRELLPFL